MELLTLTPRKPERAFDITEEGMGVLSHELMVAVLGLPHEGRAYDVIVRVAWSKGQAMGLEFVLPDDALVAALGGCA